jgi:predicted ribosomally synthesized peptide with SipW-like signal peptide
MKHRTGFLVIAALVVSLGAGGAYAYFRSSGTGSGSASTGTLLTVTAAAGTPNTPLLPGGPAGDVALTVTNPNSFAVTLVSVAGNGTIAADGGHSGCTTPGVTFTAPTGSPLPVTILANSTNQVVDLPGAASMSTASSAGCQGATFSIPVTIVVHK